MSQPVRFGPYWLDPRRGLWRGTREVRLPPRVLALLDVLLARAGEIVSKDELFRSVWPDAVVSDAALTSCVQHLRRVLEDDARVPRYVETLHRRGYRFIGRVLPCPSPAPPSRAGRWAARAEPPATREHQGRDSTSGATGADQVAFVGRKVELDRLMSLARASTGGRLHAAVIVGEIGVGKTRLVDEVRQRLDAEGWRALVGHAYESEQIVPYGPWIEGIGNSGVLGDERVANTLPRGCRAVLARLFPGLWDVGPLDGPEHHRTLFEAVAVLLRRVAAGPLLLVLENLHDADEMSIRLLLFLVRRLHDTPLLVLATIREEEIDGSPLLRMLLDELRAGTPFVTLALPPLSRAEITRLVELARSGGAVDEAAVHAVWRASEGNPLVAVETTRALEEGALSPAAANVPIPSRIQEIITARLERLSDPARALAAIAALIGRPFELRLVQHASGLAAADAAAAVDALVQRRVLKVLDERLEFSHERIRQAVLAGVLPGRRAVLHAALARSLAAVYAGRLDPHHAAIAVQAKEGGLLEMAVEHFRAAGRQALARYARREAAECFREALATLDALPEGAGRGPLAVDLRIELRSALRWLGELGTVARLLDEAEALVAPLGDRARAAWIDAYRANDWYLRGHPQEGLAPARRARAAAVDLGDFALSAVADLYTGVCLFGVGDFPAAAEALERAAATRGDVNRRELLGWVGPPPLIARGLLALVLGELGEFERGILVGQQALAAAEGEHLPYCCVQAGECLAWLHLIREDVDGAWTLLEHAASVAREWEVRILSPPIQAGRGLCLARSGRVAEGLGLLEQARQEAEAVRLPLPRFFTWLGEGYLLDGQPRRALELGQLSVTRAREHGERAAEAWAHRLLGEARWHDAARDDAAAVSHFREALALASQRRMRPLMAHCLAGLGRAGQRGGTHDAEEKLDRAAALYAELGMTRGGVTSLSNITSPPSSTDRGHSSSA